MPHREPLNKLLCYVSKLKPFFVRQRLSFIIISLFIIIMLLNYNIFTVLVIIIPLKIMLPIYTLYFDRGYLLVQNPC